MLVQYNRVKQLIRIYAMAKAEWFRRSTWTKQDQDEFYARLGRSKTLYNKSQYVRIQASHLQRAGLVRESLELLARIIHEFLAPFREQAFLAGFHGV
jgi:hypothetical protein